jgi:ATP-dependent Clp protease protease subunit
MKIKNTYQKRTKEIEDFSVASEKIDNALLEKQIYFLNGEINEDTIGDCIKWITYQNLEERPDKVLTLYVNSTGGDLYQAFALIDIMRNSRYPIQTIGIGAVMSAAFLIFISGTKGQRYASRNTSFMCHQFTENYEAKYHDIKATMKENETCNRRMVEIIREATGLTTTKIKSKLLPASDVYLSAEEMVEMGAAENIF